MPEIGCKSKKVAGMIEVTEAAGKFLAPDRG